MSRKMPPQKPGKSKQDCGTTPEFIQAVERRFGPILVDLAATYENCISAATIFISPQQDSFTVDWANLVEDRNGWLNPPFGEIPRWSAKCLKASKSLEPNGAILLLTPASIGSNWFSNNVWGHAAVFALKGRLQFVGTPGAYFKDCILSVYRNYPQCFFDIWDWRKDV